MTMFFYYVLILPLSYLPLRVLYLFSDLFYLILITVFPYRKSVIRSNLKRVFPNKKEKDIDVLQRAFYRHFSDILIEGVKNLTISTRELKQRYRILNASVLDDLYSKNKSVLLVSGHYNNWEWMITSQALWFKQKSFGIGMPLSNKFWNKVLTEKRERNGMTVVHAKNVKESLQQATDKFAVLTLSDQSPGDSIKSYWTTFLGVETAVLFGAEQLAHEFDLAVVFFSTRKVKRGYYEVDLKLLTETPSMHKWGEITEMHVKELEKLIKEQPEYWVWSHKRWKREVPADLTLLKKEQHEKFNKRFNYN